MTGNEIRTRFLEYFATRSHSVVDSSSLVPSEDPTLLFTNAGMVQFKRVFVGDDKRDYTRATTSQRCVRAGGKHNDLENVGYTARHHTFFEMLGNFSFGDYFKKEAITYAWEFLVHELGLDQEQLWVSVFEDDDEAFELWEQIKELPEGRIVRLGEKDNFWAMGDTGPCGPCSEIHIDQGLKAGCGKDSCAVGCDCDRFLELWNLVFMQFDRGDDGVLTPLPKPSIDTGMGLERIAAVLQGKVNNYDSDLFTPIITKLERLSARRYGLKAEDDTAMRVIADHARATAFLVADGVLPSNEGRGYVLRRIMRRAVRFGRNLGLSDPFLDTITKSVVGSMSHAYPHLLETTELLEKVVNNEEERFGETLEHGLAKLDAEIEEINKSKSKIISGDFVFKLYDTYGFPVDIVRDISIERGVGVDEAGFHKAMEVQKEMSRSSRKAEGMVDVEEEVRDLIAAGKETEFVGYKSLSATSKVEVIINDLAKTSKAEKLIKGDVGRIFVEKTPFYAEAGGQSGDTGLMEWDGGSAQVTGTVSVGNDIVLHKVKIENGELKRDQEVDLAVDNKKRKEIAANHTATHLLQAALKEVLGGHVKQAGSQVRVDRLRFDFTHFSPLTRDEILEVERKVNAEIVKNIVVDTEILEREAALAEGVTALFGEKYGEKVRVVSIGSFSRELCGGTHVGATGELAVVKIISEGGIASGVRRIEALSGMLAFLSLQQSAEREHQLCVKFNIMADEIGGKIDSLITTQKRNEKEIAKLSTAIAGSGLEEIINEAHDVQGVKVVAAEIKLDSRKTLREMGDKVRDKIVSGVVVLVGNIDNKVALIAIVTKDLTGKIKAGKLVAKVAELVGGKGGGRPDMAQAGGVMVDKIPEAVDAVPDFVEKLME